MNKLMTDKKTHEVYYIKIPTPGQEVPEAEISGMYFEDVYFF